MFGGCERWRRSEEVAADRTLGWVVDELAGVDSASEEWLEGGACREWGGVGFVVWRGVVEAHLAEARARTLSPSAAVCIVDSSGVLEVVIRKF